ncbi:hypothetical protein FO510_05395 [Bacillus pumilus]|uniref:hypothetical protein n=1 Tax=Bacillus pumilus TaxID=1408 RepID=UPI00017A5FC1|nr:hypothetical protein [Bacillus pumilus]EDW22598.1 hypothetical protein BAT_0154 [Bacillus pumilus ATCC 7061]MCR4352201.1 hypothetical protein [Bacillus pumilus]MCY7504012.1 hypothetical protein [Bacillus pumilus]MDR4268999.1 hypothetical protein [Bacillus pumilus]MDR4269086.1 hypothetical protein [Bacillus pumilus]
MAALKGVKTLDMVGGEITKVSYEGAEYERVERDAEVGGLLMSKEGCHDITAGAFYIINEVDRDGDAYFYDDEGDLNALSREDYIPFHKKHARLKVGDYAKVIDCAKEWKVAQGDFVKVLIDDKKYRPFQCKVQNGEFVGETVWMRESELVLATEDEVAAVKEAEAKHSVEAKWAKIGRKVDEYRKDDIVAYDDPEWFANKGFGKVGEDKGGLVRVAAVDKGGFNNVFYLEKDRITLVTPVEARFDRS